MQITHIVHLAKLDKSQKFKDQCLHFFMKIHVSVKLCEMFSQSIWYINNGVHYSNIQDYYRYLNLLFLFGDQIVMEVCVMA